MKNKRSFFGYNHYNTFMYISISLTILLIFFNLVNILEDSELKIQNSKFTGNVIDDENLAKENNLQGKNEIGESNVEKEIYTEKSYLIYYLIFGFLVLCIFILSFIFLMPRFKDLT